MSDRTRDGFKGAGAGRNAARRAARPRLESLEGRALLATLAPIANVSAPAPLGYQVPLNGGGGSDQTFTVSSDNPSIKATVAQGKFLTIGVSHTSSGANDPSFIGNLTFQLFDDLTPQTTQKIEQLVNQGFYTSPTTGTPQLPDKNFHRIANQFPGPNDYIVQGGSQSGNGSGSLNAPGYPFPDEFVQQLVFDGSGQLAMANAGDDTNDSQFFITTGQPRFLDYNHSIFGQLVSGSDTLQKMTQVAKGSDGTTPVNPILFTSTTLSNTNPNGVVHLDLTGAQPGQTAHVTVTATDTSGATTSQTFQVNATANVDANGQPINERAFLGPVANQVVGEGQTDVFQLQGVDPEGDKLTYGVGGGTNSSSTGSPFTPVSNATASVDANGVVTVKPRAGFTGVINLVVGVRDQTNRAGTTSIENIANYDTQKITLTVQNGAVVNLQPIATSGTTTVNVGTPTTVQLQGNTSNPESTTQTLQYALLSQPAHGTISNFDATKGTFTYTPDANFFGNDSVQFRVSDVGAPGPSLTSNPAVETLVVTGADTGAVRVINRVLIITPPPKASIADKSKNTINVVQTNGQIQVTVNGVRDVTEPKASDLDSIVVYGSKNGDDINVASSVLLPTTLDGGRGGGVNTIVGGGAPNLEFGWFGKNKLQGGPSNDTLYGRAGHVKFVKSGGNDLMYAGSANPGQRRHRLINPLTFFGAKPAPPHGTFYRFVGKKLIAVQKV